MRLGECERLMLNVTLPVYVTGRPGASQRVMYFKFADTTAVLDDDDGKQIGSVGSVVGPGVEVAVGGLSVLISAPHLWKAVVDQLSPEHADAANTVVSDFEAQLVKHREPAPIPSQLVEARQYAQQQFEESGRLPMEVGQAGQPLPLLPPCHIPVELPDPLPVEVVIPAPVDEPVVSLRVTSWVNSSVTWARHYYGTLRCGRRTEDVYRILTMEGAAQLNLEQFHRGDESYTWLAGSRNNQFYSHADVVRRAVELWRELFPEAKILLGGDGMPSMAFGSIDRQMLLRLNRLARIACRSGAAADEREWLAVFDQFVGLKYV